MNDGDDPLRAVRLAKLESLRELGVDPYPVAFARSDEAAPLDTRYAELPAGTETGDTVRVAGRIRAMRNSGMFIDLHDASGKIQVFSHKDYLSAEGVATLKLLDIGDVIGVEGQVRRTPRGSSTINAAALTVLAKALRPLPEKFHDRRHRAALPPALCRHREPARSRDAAPAQPRRPRDARVAVAARLSSRSRRRCCTRSRAARRPSRLSPITTRSTSTSVAHRAGAASEAAVGRWACRRRVRDQSLLPQRGAVAATQPGIHLARNLQGHMSTTPR